MVSFKHELQFCCIEKFYTRNCMLFHLYDRSIEWNEIKMSTRDEQDEEYSIKRMRERRNHQQNKTAYFIIGKIVILTILLNSQKHHASESMCKM